MMPLVMAIGSMRATWNGRTWKADKRGYDPIIEVLNEAMTESPGPSGADPYPALTRAKEIAKQLRGRIVDEGKAPTFGSAGDEVTVR